MATSSQPDKAASDGKEVWEVCCGTITDGETTTNVPCTVCLLTVPHLDSTVEVNWQPLTLANVGQVDSMTVPIYRCQKHIEPPGKIHLDRAFGKKDKKPKIRLADTQSVYHPS